MRIVYLTLTFLFRNLLLINRGIDLKKRMKFIIDKQKLYKELNENETRFKN